MDAAPALRDWLADATYPWPAVRTLRDGDPIAACFHLSALDLATTRQDKPYLRLQLTDRHGTVEARVWDDAAKVAERLRAGGFVGIRGRVHVYRGQHQLKVEQIGPVRVEAGELGLFMPRSPRDATVMERELQALLSSIQDRPLRKLLDRLLDRDSETGRLFREAPAAKRNHHAYVAGLLEHTLSLAHVCDLLARHYGSGVDRDLLIAGALLHDIGKIRELGIETGFPYTDDGKLLGHIVLGIQIVTAAAEAVPELGAERRRLLLHLIAAHQGRYEWQSAREPLTLEALLLHHADDMDAKMAQAQSLVAGTEAGWTPYDRSLGREFLRHGGAGAGDGVPGRADEPGNDAGPTHQTTEEPPENGVLPLFPD